VTVVLAGVLGISGCAAEAHYKSDPRLNSVPAISANEQLVDDLPIDLQSRVVASIRTPDIEAVISIDGGQCGVAASVGLHRFSATVPAPSTSKDPISSAPWKGAGREIGLAESVEGTAGNQTLTLYCGTKGAAVVLSDQQQFELNGSIRAVPSRDAKGAVFVLP
jgi:hypothetical protein